MKLVPVSEQIAAVERELRVRESTYRRLVATGYMSEDAAKRQMQQMQAVLKTLKELES